MKVVSLKNVCALLGAFSMMIWTVPASATLDQVKIYKEAFGAKPKCTTCHVDKLPKKGDVKPVLKPYGEKVKAAKTGEMPDLETYKAVGANPEAELAE